MKAKIEVEFLKVGHIKIDSNLLQKTPDFINVTEKTVKELCKQIKIYFKDHKIIVETKFEMEK